MKLLCVAPSSPYDENLLLNTINELSASGLTCHYQSGIRDRSPKFINGSISERIKELIEAENSSFDAMIAIRGGVGALELLDEYKPHILAQKKLPLIGYSDISILHFQRFFYADRIGIHGPVLSDLLKNPKEVIDTIKYILTNNLSVIKYPYLNLVSKNNNNIFDGNILPMNLSSLQSLLGSFDPKILKGSILALEDVNEPHYKVHRMMVQLANLNILSGLKALIIGQFSHDRKEIIEQTILPLSKVYNLPVFDWPIFGHEQPNWPLIFGQKVKISPADGQKYSLSYL